MKICDDVLKAIRQSFPEKDVNQVISEFTNALGDGGDRLQFAILILAEGDIQKFPKNRTLRNFLLDFRETLSSAGMANADWPDVVVAKGLADENWRQRTIEQFGKYHNPRPK